MKTQSHFSLNKKQRNGILFFWVVIVLIFIGICYQDTLFPLPENKIVQDEQAQLIQHKIDSLAEAKTKKKFKIFPFNPNYISDHKGYTLGMSLDEIDRLHQYREQNKWINSIQDFKKVTQVSDSLLNTISPYFKFPEWVKENKKNTSHKRGATPHHLKSDLNHATEKDLISVNGIGQTLSNRIIRYRVRIGGFIDDIQIKDIYGLPYETEQNLLDKFTVKTKNKPTLLNINSATVIQLTEIPYFDYELARRIINYRKLNEKITTFEELIKIDGFPSHKIDRIQLYLTIE
ncbi:DNA uptake protein ComE-like DNA-binding protein [Mesonia algae]|uniref:DNA uptake protein ComE-like DNA-binding protein n=1 Tax=Mesonia algae TaxID=213248 RepID=A0A2W7I064_9FLAO|nr:helix-hairpin-helix domain-containing protein [Mesonia algae]PZW38852.1 DNA uptake protein ComE-like DNA-binding protein [Mesonia algae]